MWSFKRSSNLGKSHSFPSAVRGSLTIAEKTVIRPEMSREGKTRLVLKQKKTERTRRSAKSSVLGLMNLCGNSMKSYQPKSPLKVGSSRALIASSGGSTCSIGRPRRKKTVRSQPPQSHPSGVRKSNEVGIGLLGCPRKLGSMVRINRLFHLLINGVCWGYNLHLLVTSWDIQVPFSRNHGSGKLPQMK